ncbi:MAG TPA: aerobic carbon-monoxide dehydrogenase large subunit [bacterium]|nr:aerobic carbon-monoxide dehydrogenase large subunit [bacterium]
MSTRYFGARVTRNEDPALLTGRGLFVDDVRLPGMVHGAVLRSPHAHARLRRVDARRARTAPGVLAVFTHADLGTLGDPLPKLIPHPALTHQKTQHALAPDTVRYVGEPVAFVVAESRYAAEDACDLIEVDYTPLPAAATLEAAAAAGAPRVHDDMDSNICAHYTQRVGDVDAAFAQAAHRFRERFVIDRGASCPMETRGVVASWDARTRRLDIWDSTQAPIPIRNGLAQMLGLAEQDVRVVAPDVGGGFGPKIMMFYPEEILVPFAAMRLGRAVKWIEDRREHLVATNQEREQIHDAEIAVDSDGGILGVRTIFLYDAGAYIPYGLIVPIVASTTLPGPYRVPNYHCEFRAVFTNKTMVSPYRGAGRPHGVFVMERLLDRVARELRVDRAEVRRRNFIQPDEFPYDVGLIYQDNAPLRYDSGNYPACFDRALELIDYSGWDARQSTARAAGRLLGCGVACYVEGTGIGPYEGARITVEPSGRVFVATGVGTQGQGHLTTFAQIAADVLGVSPRDVTVRTGDTGLFGWGTGTFASRAATVAGNAVALAAKAVRDKARIVAASLLEAPPEEIELSNGNAFVRGVASRSVTLGALARAANPLRFAMPKEWEGPGLEAVRYFAPSQGAFSNGVHACVVEVDAETGGLTIERYVVVHDCGRVINPLILEGQIQGGVAQGLGGAFWEKLAYDDQAQPLSTTFMDYLLPTAAEMPPLAIAHLETPSPLNPLGVKGAGEAGVIPVAAVVVQAVEDALAPFGIHITEAPLSPSRLRQLIVEGRRSP